MARTWALLVYLALTVHTWCRVMWLRLNRGLVQPMWAVPRSSASLHKVVVIGDDLAAGVGDWVTMGSLAGVAGRLAKLLARDSRPTGQKWRVVNAGSIGSTSAAWAAEGGLLDQLLDRPKLADGELFVVMLGTNDARRADALEQTPKDVAAVAEALLARGKRVVVVGVPPAVDDGSAAVRLTLLPNGRDVRTKALEVWVAQRRAAGAGDALQFVTVAGLFGRPDWHTADGKLLSRHGYKKITESVFDKVRPMVVSVEFKALAARLPSFKNNQ